MGVGFSLGCTALLGRFLSERGLINSDDNTKSRMSRGDSKTTGPMIYIGEYGVKVIDRETHQDHFGCKI
jgi:hypothetical protein